MSDTEQTALVPQPHGGAIYSNGKPKGSNGGGGRPSLITDKLITEITELIRNGNYAETAAAHVGVMPQRFHEWMAKGVDEGREPYRKFAESMLKAAAEAENKAVDAIQARYGDDWKAAGWWLERRFPKKWGRQQRIDLTVTPDLDVDI